MILQALGQYVRTLQDAYELKHGFEANAILVSMLDAMYISKMLINWDGPIPPQQQVLRGLTLISTTSGVQEPTLCLI